jgi:hypothetical protein
LRAKNPDFMTVFTAHAKEQGIGDDRTTVPDMSRNTWKQLVRECEVVVELRRTPRKAPKLIYSSTSGDLVLARINNPNALTYFDKIHAARDEDKIARMRTLPGLVGLLEHGERTQQAQATAPITSETQVTPKE